MFVLVRTIVYATLFIGLLLIYVPASLLSRSGVAGPSTLGFPQVAGMIVGAIGAAIALWCIFTFPIKGKGTPAPFDPPRKLVTQGPYRFVRNPMYIGAVVALAGTSLFYESVLILIYTLLFFLVMHLFVLLYEEPTLRRYFPNDYGAYCGRVRRWWPSLGSRS